MGEQTIRVAARFLMESRLEPPFSAEVAAQEVGLVLCPSAGPLSLQGPIVRYDLSEPGTEAELWDVVCGRLLDRAGVGNTEYRRAKLARELGGGSGFYRAVTACAENAPSAQQP